ncbi:MAG TPA: transposase [Candidatus Acidoferrum sp.]|nr:transposase [Candidatus Acidoferrum sp.]
MSTLPKEMIRVLAPFAPLFSERVFQHVQVLLAGAILTPGKRTVSSALRVMGLDGEKPFHRYHRVLSRANWSSREASRLLLKSLVEAFVPDGPLVVGVDETLERRRGKKIAAKGVYRDPVRSSHSYFVKTSALRWVSVALLAPIPWASRVWALPFLCALAPSERYCSEQGERHKKITEWAWQLLLLVRRWYPEREIVAVADGGYASLRLLDRCRGLSKPIKFITRLRLDAALYESAPPRKPGQIGRPPLKGERLANLSVVVEDPFTVWKPITLTNWYGKEQRTVETVSDTAVWHSTGLPAVPLRWVLIRDPRGEFRTQALLCTDLRVDPERIISWFVRRWQMESTFQEVRQRLGFETQRHWSQRAIQRTAPALLALFSVVTLFAHQYMAKSAQTVRQTAWYRKSYPTFSDALALVRKELWAQEETFCGSPREADTLKVSREFIERLTDAVCYAA